MVIILLRYISNVWALLHESEKRKEENKRGILYGISWDSFLDSSFLFFIDRLGSLFL